ncbi:MAG TPA: glycosyltransferase family 2 protein [Firmicutes bacterium]|nr:glycosyltransferase family 2 protein [Bacillota bacterium]HHY99166.1 glycosyltransferase family 2 protein [Bacillota bacterium]
MKGELEVLKNSPSIQIVIPAYNEESTIQQVVMEALKVTDDVTVVSDGSTDKTALYARRAGAKVIELARNVGKGGAMQEGLRASSSDIVVFLDADLIGLTESHIRSLILPVIEGRADMTVGVFKGGRAATDLALKISPSLSGQRAMRRAFIKDLDISNARFGSEIALTDYARARGARLVYVSLENVTHQMKEEKRGVFRGALQRARMYWEILKQMAARQ